MIQLSHINKTYKGSTYEVEALHDISLSVKKGEFISIMGKSGCGKSTLLNMIGFMDTPDSGEYILDGQAVDYRDKKQMTLLRNQHICFIFQHFALINELTVFENIELPLIPKKVRKKERTKQILALSEKLEIRDLLGKRPTEISGGQKQRVAIARALISECDIILADEPTGALDAQTGVQIMQLFQELHNAGKTIIVVTHDRAIAEYADKIFMLEDGHSITFYNTK